MSIVLARLLATASGHRVELRRELTSAPQQVWRQLVDPEERAAWLMPGVLEPVVGGVVDLRDEHHHVTGRVTACDPPRLLALTWSSEDAPTGEVRFEVSPRPGGGCTLLLVHEVGPGARVRGLAAGWHRLLDVLRARLSGAPPDGPTYAALLAAYDDVPVEGGGR